jgi:drug/metabolite transporter (DMT)-like permease
MGILLGLSAAICWGVADFCARFASHRVGPYRTLLYMQPLAFLALCLYVFLAEGSKIDNWSVWTLGLAALLAVGNTLAGLSLYHAFKVGVLSLVSPIAASYGAITLLLSILLSNETPSPLQLVGLVITLLGVVLASAQFGVAAETQPGAKLSKGIEWAVFASLCFGVVFWGLRFVTPELGGVVPVWVSRFVGPVLLLTLARPTHQSIKLPERAAWKWILAVGVVDTLAFLSYTFGVEASGETGVVAVLSSLFSAVTILLARIFLKEKLIPAQWGGVGLVLIGIGLVSFQS